MASLIKETLKPIYIEHPTNIFMKYIYDIFIPGQFPRSQNVHFREKERES